jgi:hypothetical protein
MIYGACATAASDNLDKEIVLLCVDYEKGKNKALTEFMLNYTLWG